MVEWLSTATMGTPLSKFFIGTLVAAAAAVGCASGNQGAFVDDYSELRPYVTPKLLETGPGSDLQPLASKVGQSEQTTE